MMKTLILLFPILAFALSPFETPASNYFDTSAYNTKEKKENIKASKNKKITCRYVCDKKVYKEQRMSDAIKFYKKTRNYSFIDNE